MITPQHVEQFKRDGYLFIKGFYDLERQIEPIHQGIQHIVEALCKKHGVETDCSTPHAAMTTGIMDLANANRMWAAEVYDAIKQIPAFMQLVADERNSQTFELLRNGGEAGLAAGGYGIRMDFPAEEKFRALWHQEFPAQLRSADGVVFWSPLLPIHPNLGPVEIKVGSHVNGMLPVYSDDAGVGRSGAYALKLENEEALLSKYDSVAPLTEPGDLILMDFMSLHQSGTNRASHPRWSMQFRYFNFDDPIGLNISWKGSFASGIDFSAIMPELKSNH